MTIYSLSYAGPDPYVYGVYTTARKAYQALLHRYADLPWKIVSVKPALCDDRIELMNTETGEVAIWFIDEMSIDDPSTLPCDRYTGE